MDEQTEIQVSNWDCSICENEEDRAGCHNHPLSAGDLCKRYLDKLEEIDDLKARVKDLETFEIHMVDSNDENIGVISLDIASEELGLLIELGFKEMLYRMLDVDTNVQ